MGLLDRNKRKPVASAAAGPAQPSAAAAGSLPASAPTGADTDSLRDMLIAAVAARDNKLVLSLVNANRQTILGAFSNWQRVPEPIRENGGAMQRYAQMLIQVAELFRDKLNDSSLAELLRGPAPSGVQGQWEAGLRAADSLLGDLRYDEAIDILQQMVEGLQQVPTEGPIPFHAVTHGRLAHALFSKGEADKAAEHMQKALELSEQRNDEQGTAAALRGIYEIRRYKGDTAGAAELGDRLAAQFQKLNNEPDAKWWRAQAARVRAGEPPCRIVFFINDQQYEVDDVPPIKEGSLRYGFVRNRAPLGFCEALVRRGMEMGQQAKFEEALAAFRQAARVDPLDPSPTYQEAVTLMHLEKPAEAVQAYDLTERLAPGWFNCRAERWAAAEIAEGRVEPQIFFILRTEEMPDASATWDQKLSLVDQAMEKAGQLPPLLLYRGRCMLRLGRIQEAETVLRAGIENASEPDVRTRLLVDLQMIVSDPAEKIRLLNEAISLNGNLAAAAVAKVTLKQLLTPQGA